MSRVRVTYTGESPVRLGNAGVFGPGTTAYVDEATAAEARKLGGFIVEADAGSSGGVVDATPQPVAKVESSGATVAADKSGPAPAAAQPEKGGGDKKPEGKKDEAKKEEGKKDDKKADASAPPAGDKS